MRILILTPAAYPALTGNAITTERWRRSLTEKGIVVEVLSSDGLNSGRLFEELQRFRPDLLHVYHAFKSGALLLQSPPSSFWNDLPIVVSPGGTDINIDLEEPEREKTVIQVLRMASLLVVQSLEIVQRLARQTPELAGRIITIPKAVNWFGNAPYDLREITGGTQEDVLFFLPAGIRPVKGNLECLLAMELVRQQRPNIRFAAAGPAVNAEYAARFEREVNRLGVFARWIPSISPAEMKFAYESSDIVLNFSRSEGLSNSLLEAVAAGRPFLASDIPGNRQSFTGEKRSQRAGLLFDLDDRADFVRKAVKLIDNENLRAQLGDAARVLQHSMPGPAEEADALIAAYRIVLSQPVHRS
jgi:glycosyltransferase involved in cell wall biosynthesis